MLLFFCTVYKAKKCQTCPINEGIYIYVCSRYIPGPPPIGPTTPVVIVIQHLFIIDFFPCRKNSALSFYTDHSLTQSAEAFS